MVYYEGEGGRKPGVLTKLKEGRDGVQGEKERKETQAAEGKEGTEEIGKQRNE
jgi:hypothetical protein